ncbi:site-specific integrase [archaeon]|jgi:integrase/recombinase XerD|nr:site-specific integrase [archaeon]MBT4647750.1 site-specific integrase [archaeon]
MALDDIYKSEGKYLKFKENLNELLLPPAERSARKRNAIYYVKNQNNLKYFKKLFRVFEAKDNSFIRRLRLLRTFVMITHVIKKDLCDCTRDDIDEIMAFMHTKNKSPRSKRDFVIDIKYIWKQILPEKDEKGRVDDTLIPYPVRHLSSKQDRSTETKRKDRMFYDEFEKLIVYFAMHPMIQAYLAFALESLARPQEIFFLRISDFQFFKDYAKVYMSSHGKEGLGLLQCIDSFPSIIKWYNKHPNKNNPDAFFFLNLGNKNTLSQMTPDNMNRKLKKACKELGITKLTCYSLKRNGITFRRLRGESDMEVQHAARWTSTKQLKTYDKSNQEDAFRIQLIKKGKLKPTKKEEKRFLPETKNCPFCEALLGFSEKVCTQCKHVLDASKIKEDMKNNDEWKQIVTKLNSRLGKLEEFVEWTKKTQTVKKAIDKESNMLN